jgi:hypothetical protein
MLSGWIPRDYFETSDGFEPLVMFRDLTGICLKDPRSQTRDLGHPSDFLRSGFLPVWISSGSGFLPVWYFLGFVSFGLSGFLPD